MYAIVFLASFCLMLVQLVSGRALAPYLGYSVYIWTAVIGTTLLGISFGNAAGGRLADKNGDRRTLGISLIAGGAAVLVSNYALTVLAGPMSQLEMHVGIRALMMSFALFFPAAFFLSTISPQALKIRLKDLKHAGQSVGTLAASSAAGSIIGTFLGGYLLISSFGTKNVLSAVSLLLVALGLAVASKERLWKNPVFALLVLFMVGDLFVPGICRMETNYYCIRVKTAGTDGDLSYTLRLDHLIHSYVHPADPTELGYGYERVYANLIAMHEHANDSFNTFFIGGGGYVMPRYLNAQYPKASVIVDEIDPGVTEANHKLMGLKEDANIKSDNEDARIHLIKPQTEAPYDFVFGDAFNDFSVPSHLTTLEFHQRLKERMSPHGVYALNIIDDVRYGNFLASMLRTLGSVWKHVYVAPLTDKLDNGRNTITLIATDDEINRDLWSKTVSPAFRKGDQSLEETERKELTLLSDDQVQAFLTGHQAPALFDDYAPTDRYLGPVFRDAY